MLSFTVNVDEDTAPSLNNGHDQLEDILVLHLEKGKDFFITVTGNYLPSCFGSSLETLVHLHTYIREVPVAQLVDLVCVDVKKEIVRGVLSSTNFSIPHTKLLLYVCVLQVHHVFKTLGTARVTVLDLCMCVCLSFYGYLLWHYRLRDSL